MVWPVISCHGATTYRPLRWLSWRQTSMHCLYHHRPWAGVGLWFVMWYDVVWCGRLAWCTIIWDDCDLADRLATTKDKECSQVSCHAAFCAPIVSAIAQLSVQQLRTSRLICWEPLYSAAAAVQSGSPRGALLPCFPERKHVWGRQVETTYLTVLDCWGGGWISFFVIFIIFHLLLQWEMLSFFYPMLMSTNLRSLNVMKWLVG